MIAVSDIESECVESVKIAQAKARDAIVALDALGDVIFSQAESGVGAKLSREFIEIRGAVDAILTINVGSVKNVPRALELACATCDSSFRTIVNSFEELGAIKRHPSSIGHRRALIDVTSKMSEAVGTVMNQMQASRNVMLEALGERRVGV